MSHNESQSHDEAVAQARTTREPSRGEKLKPIELVVISAVLGVFAAAVVMMATQDFKLVFVFGVGGFIIALITIAMLGLGARPNDLEQLDIDFQRRSNGHSD